MSDLKALTDPGSPTAAPLIAGAAALVTTAGTALSMGVPLELTAVSVAMLADLMKAIPAQRAANNANEAIRKLRQDMDDHQVQMDRWTDQQHQFVTSMVHTILTTGEAEKLEFLRRAAMNVATNDAVVRVGGAFLTRTLRDITAQELSYLVSNFGRKILLPEDDLRPETVAKYAELAEREGMVYAATEDAREIVTGLQTLGLLRTAASRHAAEDLDWNPTAGKILTLVRTPSEAIAA